ncbi:hypothetical protein [Sphingomonas astaxanthinifaciens]|uniref:Uncharacterized protein n=1 Tax=Sphingomonas astaxanthinifaciens DSM 22298 TaxID=1123267 RepID=A0ABQ5Z7I1_9SPHN|nr:hypothetical protein [Sphingomonas astaxanthinifaciens]GLR48760.1 hypothetical protein GCM10007925_24810 [Sphingomonas astaxanthinifaciens DSM 22298]
MLGAVFLAAWLSTPGPFVLVNGTGSGLTQIAIRQSSSSGVWKPLGGGALSPGARASEPAPGGELCAFDIRGKAGDTLVTWQSVNLCDVKVVTLNRRSDGTAWVDYD